MRSSSTTAATAETSKRHSDGIFTVAKLQGGYVRYLKPWRGLQPGFGGGLSAGIVPSALESEYGNRVNFGIAVFATLRPTARGH